MYKLTKNNINVSKENNGIASSIPFDLNNRDYQNFKKEINDDFEQLQEYNGNTMTAAEAKAFVATLP